MDIILIVGVVTVVGAIIAAIIAVMLKKYIAGATFQAGLTPDDRREIIQMRTFLDNMRKERAEQNEAQAKRAGRLEAQIEGLGKFANNLDASTHKLERALRSDSQVMGSWGEMQLKKVLELSGLTEGVSYTYQETLASGDSTRRNLRTDVQVKLPNDKVIVIDSKNTMSSYLDYNAAEIDEDREIQAERIIESVRNHMDEIMKASYQTNIKNCYERVLMYFPFEIPYLLACRAEIKVGDKKMLLREYAYENDIIFVTASNLLPILDGVSSMWGAQNQDKKIQKFIEEADKLCLKMNTFLTNYRKLGKQLADMGATYREGMGQLAEGKGNVIKKLGELKDVNVKSAEKLLTDEDLMEHANKVTEAL